MWRDTYPGGEVAARLELLEKGGHEDGGEEEDHAPEEDVGDIRAVGAAGGALELAVQHLALLLAPDDMVMMAVVMVDQEEEQMQEGDSDASKND